jgi:hypothetical protein
MDLKCPSETAQVNRTAILVLGMHRSGTSALSGMLVRLGAEPPRNLLPPASDNPLGFWESAAFVAFHERLLHFAGALWNSWTSFNVAAATYFSREWRLLLEQEFGSAPLFVVKDPRLCRVVPFWLQNLSDNQIAPAAVLSVRNPFEVARSLSARNGFGMEQTLLMWLRHVLDSELETRTAKRCFVSYPQLLANWRAVADKIAGETGVQWPEQTKQADAEISQFIRPELRHQIVGGGLAPVASGLAEWIQSVSAALDELVEKGSDTQGPLRALDDVRREFDQQCDVFGPPFDDVARTTSRSIFTLEAKQEQSEARIAALAAEGNEVRALAVHLESERSLVEQRASQLGMENKELREQAASLAIEARHREAHFVTLEQEIGRLRQGWQASEQCVQALLESRSWRCTAPLRAVMTYLRRAFPARSLRPNGPGATAGLDPTPKSLQWKGAKRTDL